MRYPIGIQTFEEIINGKYVYADKTDLVYNLAQSHVCFLSRPRRFGKSLLVSTLEAYFSGKKELFRGLKIEELEQEWTEYPVFRVDFAGGNYDIINQLKLVFRPGLILYILPQVSVEASLGLADVSYTFSDAYSENRKVGSFGKWGLGARFNILNCNFGIAYHF